MAYIVTEACINCKYTDCAVVCPVDCFHEGPNFLAIDPDECISCGLCEPECPTKAIYSEDNIPEDMKEYTEVNARLAKGWPVIKEKKEALPTAEEFKEKKGKRALLKEA